MPSDVFIRSGILLGLLLLSSQPLPAGTLTGQVSARGKELPAGADKDDPYASRRLRFVETVDYESMKDFVVYVEGPMPAGMTVTGGVVRIVVQQDATFRPAVMPIMAGTTVEWPNEDDIYHNVFSFSSPRPFDLGLYKEEIKRVTFPEPGRVDVFCSIHKNMNCIILVLENPWFASTDSRGRYRIENIPAGTYRVTAWHKRLPPLTRDIEIPEEGAVNADFIMGISGIPEI